MNRKRGNGGRGGGKKSLPKLGTGARFKMVEAMAAAGRKRRGAGRKGR